MGCMMSRTEEGTPYAVGVHVDWGVVEGRRETRLQRASVGGGRRKVHDAICWTEEGIPHA